MFLLPQTIKHIKKQNFMNRPLNLSLEDKLNKPLLENSAGNQYQRHMKQTY